MLKSVCIILLCLQIGQVGTTAQSSLDRPTHVSIYQLIANPEKYDGKLISVIGYITLGREDDYLYAHEGDAAHFISMNGIGFRRSPEIRANEKNLNRKYVRMIGIFRKADKDQAIIGTIGEVKQCVPWSDPTRPMRDRLKEIPGIRSTQPESKQQ